MKRILLVMLMFIGMNVSAQEYSATKSNNTRTFNQIDDNYYSVVVRDGEGDLHQTGYYELSNNTLKRDGLWRLYGNDGKVLTTALFEDNKVVWIKADGVKYTSEEIEIHRLRQKVTRLETLIAGTN